MHYRNRLDYDNTLDQDISLENVFSAATVNGVGKGDKLSALSAEMSGVCIIRASPHNGYPELS